MDYQAFFEQSSDLMVVLDTKLTIASASDAFLKASKTSREKIIGAHLFDVFPDNPDEINSHGGNSIRASINRVLKTKAPDILPVVKYDIPTPDGGGFIQKYWKTTHSPVFDNFNQVQYIIQVAEDVTENETLITQLKQEEKALKLIEDSEKRYNMMLMKSPFGFAVFKGENMVITLANDSMRDGKPLSKSQNIGEPQNKATLQVPASQILAEKSIGSQNKAEPQRKTGLRRFGKGVQ